MMVSQEILKAFRVGMRAVKAGKFVLSKGQYWGIRASGKPCGCACGMIAYGFGMTDETRAKTGVITEEMLGRHGMSGNDLDEISKLYEDAPTVEIGINWVGKFLRATTRGEA